MCCLYQRQAVVALHVCVGFEYLGQQGRSATEPWTASRSRDATQGIASSTASEFERFGVSQAHSTMTYQPLVEEAIFLGDDPSWELHLTLLAFLSTLCTTVLRWNARTIRCFIVPVVLHTTEDILDLLLKATLEVLALHVYITHIGCAVLMIFFCLP